MKPLPAKGYVRADFVIEQSAFDSKVRYLRLHSRSYVSGGPAITELPAGELASWWPRCQQLADRLSGGFQSLR
jgi:hypothetical protein